MLITMKPHLIWFVILFFLCIPTLSSAKASSDTLEFEPPFFTPQSEGSVYSLPFTGIVDPESGIVQIYSNGIYGADVIVFSNSRGVVLRDSFLSQITFVLDSADYYEIWLILPDRKKYVANYTHCSLN